MERREPPPTEEGWYALHDLRRVDWDAWRAASERERERAVEEGARYLREHDAPEEGDSAAFWVLGHKADLMLVHLRPTPADLDRIERRFERTAFADFAERAASYVSVTEVSGYATEGFDGEGLDRDAVDEGTRRYIESRLYPAIPDAEHVSFYPMSKRRDPEYNWYDLPFEERAELMGGHGDVGRDYAGRVTQIITGSVGFDDHEWGVTLFADDPADVKRLLYEMRFDPSSSRYAVFGTFYFGRRFEPADLGALLAGETVPAGDDAARDDAADDDAAVRALAGGQGGDPDDATADTPPEAGDDDGIRDELEDLDVYAGRPHGEDVHATVLYSEADVEELFDEVEGLRANFEHYETHVTTTVYESRDADRSAVASIWETASAAETAAGFLADLPGVVSRADERADGHAGEESGFGTMGLFYTVEPEHREEFVAKFDTVEDLLDDTDGHLRTDLLVNHEDENDMFIASQWRSKEDAVAFFRSEEFRETVSWGRDVLADRPRHVFLA